MNLRLCRVFPSQVGKDGPLSAPAWATFMRQCTKWGDTPTTAQAALPSNTTAVPTTTISVGDANEADNQGNCQLLNPATPYHPFPRGKFHTWGNVWILPWADMNAAYPPGPWGRSALCVAFRDHTIHNTKKTNNVQTTPTPAALGARRGTRRRARSGRRSQLASSSSG